jgi:flavin reductase (DIM6/NTAB) family NADH-FMN oxidoreductase RutF
MVSKVYKSSRLLRSRWNSHQLLEHVQQVTMAPQFDSQHIEISPAILYWGTPVCLISTVNPDGSYNVAPMSSVFWLGHSCMLGLETGSQTTQNILRTNICTLNLASDDLQEAVNAIAKTTGTDPVPPSKLTRGYTHVKDKFGHAKLTPLSSDKIDVPGIAECPVVMEASLVNTHSMFKDQPFHGAIICLEVRILNVKIHRELKLEGHRNRIDTDKWKPMIMMFSELYGLRSGRLAHSKLAEIEEELYRPFTGTKIDAETGED